MLEYLGQAGKLPAKKETKQVLQQPPRISSFSGDTSKGDAAFDLWRYEVKCLLKEGVHTEDSIHQAIRKSLKGEAGRLAMHLGTDATIDDVIKKLQGVFGVVETSETLLANFYSAKQRDDETVVSWGCRLEDLLDRAKEQGIVESESVDEMLRTQFWRGLTRNLKDASRYKFDTVKEFDKLLVELRAIEQEYKGELPSTSQKAQSKLATVGAEAKSEMQELKKMVGQLTETVGAICQQMNKTGQSAQTPKSNDQPRVAAGTAQHTDTANSARNEPTSERGVPVCNYCREPGHIKWNCPVKAQMTCYRCRQQGHLARDCGVRMDHNRRQQDNLNC